MWKRNIGNVLRSLEDGKKMKEMLISINLASSPTHSKEVGMMYFSFFVFQLPHTVPSLFGSCLYYGSLL